MAPSSGPATRSSRKVANASDWSPAKAGFVARSAREVGVVERRLRVVLRVVQVGAGVERDRRLVGERRVRVQQVALVLRDLAGRVQRVARLAAVVDGHAVGDVRAADLGPLLELDDDGGVARCSGSSP